MSARGGYRCQVHRFARNVLLTVSLLVWPWNLMPNVIAQEKPAGSTGQSPPADTAILTLSLPDKATITMNGQAVAVQRKYEFQPLQADTLYTYQLRITMPDGSQRDRTLLLRGGWNVELTIPASVAARPEIMPQTGHALSIWGSGLQPRRPLPPHRRHGHGGRPLGRKDRTTTPRPTRPYQRNYLGGFQPRRQARIDRLLRRHGHPLGSSNGRQSADLQPIGHAAGLVRGVHPGRPIRRHRRRLLGT